MEAVIVLSIIAAFLVASHRDSTRLWGYAAFAVVDVAWIFYAFYIGDNTLALQFMFFLFAAVYGIGTHLIRRREVEEDGSGRDFAD